MKTIDPSSAVLNFPKAVLRWGQSIHKAINGNIDMGAATSSEPSNAGINAGVYSQFERGNSSGQLIRIASNGNTTTQASYLWAGSNVGIVINHNLGRQPIGFHVVDQDKAVTIYRTAPPTSQQITLAPTDNSANVTVYIF